MHGGGPRATPAVSDRYLKGVLRVANSAELFRSLLFRARRQWRARTSACEEDTGSILCKAATRRSRLGLKGVLARQQAGTEIRLLGRFMCSQMGNSHVIGPDDMPIMRYAVWQENIGLMSKSV